MKQVLVIDEALLFQEYLLSKLGENKVEGTVVGSGWDGISKMRSIVPDLIIMDYDLNRQGCMELLKHKKESPTYASIPVILTAQHLNQEKILELLPYNVKKVFTKPVKIDTLLTSLEEILGIPFNVDKSPGIVDVHVNEGILFIEITEGLNIDKLDILKFKIVELIELYRITNPKVIIMLSGFILRVSEDRPKLFKLFDNVLTSSKANQKNVRVLTMDEFANTYIELHEEFQDIEVVTNLQQALDGLLEEPDDSESSDMNVAFIDNSMLSTENAKCEVLQLRFDGDSKFSQNEIHEIFKNLHVAVVDDDKLTHELIKQVFFGFETKLSIFNDGAEFVATLNKEEFDLIILDLIMPRMDGFAVLRELRDNNNNVPVVILSGLSQRETVIRTFQMGSKSYLIKPLKPEDISKKILEILKVNV
jgi:DNA-binding response OmpR family regulator